MDHHITNNQQDTGTLTSFRDLIVWQKAHELVLSVYRFTRRFPSEESYGLTAQFRKAATSIASRIAEGFSSPSSGKKMQLLMSAQSALEACNYYTILSEDLSYGSNREISSLITEVDTLLSDHIRKVRNNMALGF